MNDKEYLKQISSAVRPEKKSKMSFLSSPIAKALLIGVVGLIVIIIIGSILGGGKAGTVSKTASLKFHLDNTATVISDYRKLIKSSNLRSSSASLYSVLTNTSKEVAEILPKLGFSSNSADGKKLSNKAVKNKDALENDLFEAKINGNLKVLSEAEFNKIANQSVPAAADKPAAPKPAQPVVNQNAEAGKEE